jgi:hypothetical protein
VATLCEIPTDNSVYPSVCNHRRTIPSVFMAWLVIVWQLYVNHRRILSVGKAVGIYVKYIYINNLLIGKL